MDNHKDLRAVTENPPPPVEVFAFCELVENALHVLYPRLTT